MADLCLRENLLGGFESVGSGLPWSTINESSSGLEGQYRVFLHVYRRVGIRLALGIIVKTAHGDHLLNCHHRTHKVSPCPL